MENEKKDFELIEDPQKNSRSVVLFIAIIIVLTLGLGFLIFLHFNQRSKMIEMETVLTAEKDSLANELTKLMYQYDTLKTNNDSLNIQIDAQQDRIQNLLAVQVSNAQKIQLYKKELATLREVMKSYIRQIDSLNTKNIKLLAENKEVRDQLNVAQKSNEELSKLKEELTSKVEIAATLQAKNVLAVPINDRGREKDKIQKVDKIRVCFTLRENPIAEAGTKEIFMRLVRPDDLVLVRSAEDLFEYQEEYIPFSASRIVEYMNQDVDVCIYWDNNGQLIPGTYLISLYLEGEEIGTTSLLLK
jgi:hypothetical protein